MTIPKIINMLKLSYFEKAEKEIIDWIMADA